jgi:hypothetical protein
MLGLWDDKELDIMWMKWPQTNVKYRTGFCVEEEMKSKKYLSW